MMVPGLLQSDVYQILPRHDDSAERLRFQVGISVSTDVKKQNGVHRAA